MAHKVVLSIQDYSSIGRCSLTAAIPIINACGQEIVGLPTSLLSTQTAGIKGFTFIDLADNMMPAYKHWEKLGYNFDYFYSGFLGSIPTVENAITIVKSLKKKGTIIAVDPAMAEDGKLYTIFDEAYKDKMISLCKYADILMPNFTESKMLAGLSLDLEPNEANARMILKILHHNGYKTVLLSGISPDDETIGTALLDPSGRITFQYNKKIDAYIHGAGDILSSVFIGKIMSGMAKEKAAQAAVNFCYEVIKVSIAGKADPRYGMFIEQCLPLLYK